MSELCMNCFAEIPAGQGRGCPVCGWDNAKAQRPGALPYGTVLFSRYVAGRCKSANGEGLTYAALDSLSQRVVEVREFFPGALADRAEDGRAVPREGAQDTFQRELAAFLELCKAVSRLRELSVVASLLEIFEENDTAYAVYEYIPAVSLRKYVETGGGRLSWNETYQLFLPVLTALGLINSLGQPHLGVSPETLRVRGDGTLFLTGFSIRDVRQRGTPLEPELFPGCAAPEQYRRGGACGEVSDVYGFAACLVYALTGRLPEEAPRREENPRLLISREVLRGLPDHGVAAIANALHVRSDDRTPSFEHLKSDLSSASMVVNQVSETEAIRRLPSMDRAMPRHRGLPPVVWLLGSLAITLVVLVIVAGRWLGEQGMSFSDLGRLFEKSSASETAGVAPDLVNQSYETAAARSDLHLVVSERIFSDTVEEGSIISQSPFAGEEMAPGDSILVTVSRGSQRRALPAVEGLSYAQLEDLLAANGLTAVRAEEPSETVDEGFVIRYENCQPGDSLNYGASVTVVVSSGP